MALENNSKRPRIIKELNLNQIKGEGSPQGVLYGLRGAIFLDLLTNIFYEGQNSLTWTELGPETKAGGLFYQGTWNANTNAPTLTSGIGTTGHFYVVDVAGTTNLNGITDWEVGDWAVFVQGVPNSWQKIDNSSSIGGSGTGNYVAKWSGSGYSNTLTDSLIYDNGTNVGIGTSNPTGILEIENTLRIQTGTDTNIYSHSKEMVFQSNKGFGNIFNFRYGNSTRMVIDSTGNVGIGTTSPGQKLHVVGEGKIQGNLMIGSSGDVAGAVGQLHIKGSNAQVIVLEDTDNANLVVRLSAEETVGFKIEDTTHSNVLFFGDESGNVGIGTTSPSEKLEVAGEDINIKYR
tara:strand:- start:1485 stop:2522 length:1038 start_codon:yes stop_codon:yes gene_type:complete